MKPYFSSSDFDLTKYESKKNKILNAFLKCIYEHGVAGLTVRQVAQEAKINLGTLHYYFKSKESLYIEFLRVLFDRFIYDIERRYKPSDPPEKKLEAFFESGKFYIGKQKNLFVVFIDLWSLAIRNSQMQKIFTELYEKLSKVMDDILGEGVKKGVFNNVKENTLSTFFIAFAEGIGLHWHMRNGSFDLNEHFDVICKNLREIIIKK